MTMTLDGSGASTIGVPNSAAAQNASGTTVNFTGIPAGIKRLTVSMANISTNGTSVVQLQIGSGSFSTSGYTCNYSNQALAGSVSSGAYVGAFNSAVDLRQGTIVFTLLTPNQWCFSGVASTNTSGQNYVITGTIALSGALDRVRLTTVNGTDTFDNGSINILYE